jgi:hypothetical protein
MDALEELKKRHEEEKRQQDEQANAAARRAAERQAAENERNDPKRITAEIEAFIHKLQSFTAKNKWTISERNEASNIGEALAGSSNEAIYIGQTDAGDMQYHPSLDIILEHGELSRSAWETIVQHGYIKEVLPKDNVLWVPVLNSNRDLADRLILAAQDVKNRRYALYKKKDRKMTIYVFVLTPLVLILGIGLGFITHSFKVGLIGLLIAAVLFFVGILSS